MSYIRFLRKETNACPSFGNNDLNMMSKSQCGREGYSKITVNFETFSRAWPLYLNTNFSSLVGSCLKLITMQCMGQLGDFHLNLTKPQFEPF